jgi:uncharacterized protein YdhG (YjbR/CyaY superfamily)
MKDTQRTAKRTTAADQTYDGFTADERAAMKERARELKATSRRNAAPKGDDEADLLAKIAEMTDPDRTMAERLHAVIRTNAPGLAPKLWYGMPAYARDGKVVCFFQPAQKVQDQVRHAGLQRPGPPRRGHHVADRLRPDDVDRGR